MSLFDVSNLLLVVCYPGEKPNCVVNETMIQMLKTRLVNLWKEFGRTVTSLTC